MKALVLHGPKNYQVETNWQETQPEPGWARIKVSHAGICGSDLSRFGEKGAHRHPLIPGHEFSGVVETPAANSTRYQKGERVAALPVIACGRCPECVEYGAFHCKNYRFLGSRDDGGFAEYCSVPETNLFRLPENADLQTGAFIEPIAVALHVVRESRFVAGSDAMVFGTGTIGLLIAFWLRIFGAGRVVLADVREESLRIARQCGFDEVINPSKTEISALPRFDFVYEAAGAQRALQDGIERARNRGAVTIVGRDVKDTVIPLAVFERLMRKELVLKGCWGYDLRSEENLVRQVLENADFPLSSLVTQEISLLKAPETIGRMLDGSLYFCKVMINMERNR